MRVAAIDVATTSGWAVVEQLPGGRETVVATGHRRLTNRSAYEVVELVLEVMHHCPELLALEAPYVGRSDGTALVLAELLGRVRQEIERWGHETIVVRASQWQQGILAGLATPSSPRAMRKRAAKIWAASSFGLHLGEDEADALGLATWALRTRRLERGRAA